jgi:hypothetical protein
VITVSRRSRFPPMPMRPMATYLERIHDHRPA